MTVGIAPGLRDTLLTYMLNYGSPSRPADVYYLKWHTADPGAAGTTAASTMLPDRDVLAGNTPFWEDGTGVGVAKNTTLGESSVAGAGTETISHFSCWPHATTGTVLFTGTTTSSPITEGDKLTYGAGDLTVTITGAA